MQLWTRMKESCWVRIAKRRFRNLLRRMTQPKVCSIGSNTGAV